MGVDTDIRVAKIVIGMHYGLVLPAFSNEPVETDKVLKKMYSEFKAKLNLELRGVEWAATFDEGDTQGQSRNFLEAICLAAINYIEASARQVAPAAKTI